MLKTSTTDALKTTSKRAILRAAEAVGNSTENKIADKITIASRNSPQNCSETIESKTEHTGFDREIPKERYLYISRNISLKLLMI